MTVMRAKFVLQSVTATEHAETLLFNAVCKPNGYPADGLDEDNTYAKFSPSAKLEMTVTNPALWGKLRPGAKYYVDFTEAVALQAVG